MKPRNGLTEVNHILTRVGPRLRSQSLHAEVQGVDDKNVQYNMKFVIGKICRPWRRVSPKDNKEDTILILARRSYNVYTSVCLSRKATEPHTTVLDTTAVSSIFRKSDVSSSTERLIRAPTWHSERCKRKTDITQWSNSIPLLSWSPTAYRYVLRSLQAFHVDDNRTWLCHGQMEAIWPSSPLVEFGDGTTLPMVLKPPTRSGYLPPLQLTKSSFQKRNA